MSKRGDNIYKRKDGRWEGRMIKGHEPCGKAHFSYVYARSYSEVKRKLAELRDNAAKEQSASRGRMALDTILDDWLRSMRSKVKESTYVQYVHLIDRHIRPELGAFQVNRITTQILENFVQQKLSDGRLNGVGGLSAKTVTNIITILKSVFGYAQDNGIPISCRFNRITIWRREATIRVLSRDEQASLVKVLLQDTDLPKLGVLLSLYTGIRIGELCALTWADISLDSSVLSVRKTMQRIQVAEDDTTPRTKVIVTIPKSKCSIREIPLPACLHEVVGRFFCSPDSYILTGSPNKYVEPRTMQNHFRKYVAESGIATANYHCLRHTFATRCVELGFEIKTLSEILGHANVNITLNRYIHASYALKRGNMNKLSL